MPKRLLLLLLTWAVFALAAGAQVYEPGLLVRSNGDTLRGEVENAFWVEPPTFIRFRPAPASPSQLFQPRQLRAVRFSGGRQFRYEVLAIDHAAETQLNHLPQGYHPAMYTDSVLAETLLAGDVSLLRVVRPGSVHYFLLHPDRPALELAERKYLRKSQNGSLAITDGNNYRNQLLAYFADCPAARELASAAAFTPEALVTVSQAYNASCGPSRVPGRSNLVQAAPRRRVSFQGGVLAGVRYNRLVPPITTQEVSCPDCRPWPFAGLFAELFLPSRITAIYGELSLSPFSNQVPQLITFAPGTNAPVYTFYNYRGWLGTARLGLRYFFPLPQEQQFLFGFGFELNEVFAPAFTSTVPPTPTAENLTFASPTIFPNLGVGWRTQRFTAFLDGQMYTSSDEGLYSQFFGSNFSLRLGLGYRLGGNSDSAAQRHTPKQ
ncbi:MAG: hypothetical protein JWR44_3765 [Hymenobacter sp.]|jgi:hypothetical protein|nr:hypothetical protein [Hymenobacter sp.]